MKFKFFITALFIVFTIIVNAQNISVKSFKSLPTDMTARATNPLIDQNGEKCALIKVKTTQTGFVFDGDMNGIMKKEHKVAEYWVYVPRGSKKLAIKHQQLGSIDFFYTESIKEATVYELQLTTGKVVTTVEDYEVPTQWVVITSDPKGADIYIDDLLVGNTGSVDKPYQGKLEVGKHTYRIEKALYHSQAGVFDLTEENKKELHVKLKPNFGFVFINTKPEQGASVEIDGIPAGKTPFTSEKLSPGKHTATFKKVMFKPKTVDFEIFEGDRRDLNVELDPTFATVNITTDPKADIYIDDVKKGYGSYSDRLLPGLHTFEAKKNNYYSDKRQQDLQIGDDINLSLHLRPRTGSLDIKTEPFNASITIDGVDHGKTPNTIKDLLIGEHNVVISKEGYKSITKEVTINENETQSLDENLADKPMTGNLLIETEPSYASIMLNGRYRGKTPITIKDLTTGEYRIYITKENYKSLTVKVRIKDGETVTLDEILEKEREIDYSNNNSSKNKPATKNVKQKYKGGPGNMFLSILIPGLGDKRVSGESGTPRAVGVYSLLAGGYACKLLSDVAYDEYHDAATQEDMDTYYEMANGLHKLYYVFTATGIVVWIYDVIWVANKGFKNNRKKQQYSGQFNVNYNPEINGVALSFNIKF